MLSNPVFTDGTSPADFTVKENMPVGTNVGSIRYPVTDADAGDTLTYSLDTDDTDSAPFTAVDAADRHRCTVENQARCRWDIGL